MDPDRLEIDELPKDQPSSEVVPLEFEEEADDTADGLPIRGRGDETRLPLFVLAGLHKILGDEGLRNRRVTTS